MCRWLQCHLLFIYIACLLVGRLTAKPSFSPKSLMKPTAACSHWSNVLVSHQFLHPLDFAFVLGHGPVVQPVPQQVLLAVVDLGAVLELEGAESVEGPQQHLDGVGEERVGPHLTPAMTNTFNIWHVKKNLVNCFAVDFSLFAIKKTSFWGYILDLTGVCNFYHALVYL